MISSVLTWLDRSACLCPDGPAFSDRDTALTWSQLRMTVRRAGSEISRRLDGGRREPVAVLIGRNVSSVAAFLSVAAAGCFWVPVDPTLPAGRLGSIFVTVRPRLVISAVPEIPEDLPSVCGAPVVPFSELSAGEEDADLMDLVAASAADTDPLYCIFTSGSTGVPKGVLVSHRSVINMADQFSAVFPVDGTSVFGNQAPFDFDVSVKDIALALRNAGHAHILERALFSAPKRLIGTLDREGVNTLIWSVSAMKIVSLFKTFASVRPESLRLVMFSGEVLPVKILRDWQEALPEADFVNLYGPTEITCNCTYYKVSRRFTDGESLPVGVPFPNTRVLLLDGDREITAPGETGEICVRGSCLALGYYNDPDRTAAAFCQNPAACWPERIYRTGDLGAWAEDGNLSYIGRADSQVKYMGFRIELGEIEVAANAIPFVDGACCLFDAEREQLCLFYAAARRDDRGVTEELKKVLPAWMVPRRLFYFEKLPENRTGKIDRAALRRDHMSI